MVENQHTVEIIGGRYQLQATFGEGGMGSVYRALDRLTGETVAVKRVLLDKENVDSEGVDTRIALAQEFQTLASLRHPHITTLQTYVDYIVVGTPTTLQVLPHLSLDEAFLFQYLLQNNQRLEQEHIHQEYAI